MTKLLALNRGLFALVDDSDFDILRQYRWFVHRYVYRTERVDGRNKNISLHRAVLNAPHDLEVDHINFDRLDNRRINLRLATHSQNQQNRTRVTQTSKTGVRGVEFRPQSSRPYRACVWLSGKRCTLGNFSTLEEADAAARQGRSELMTHAPECLVKALP